MFQFYHARTIFLEGMHAQQNMRKICRECEKCVFPLLGEDSKQNQKPHKGMLQRRGKPMSSHKAVWHWKRAKIQWQHFSHFFGDSCWTTFTKQRLLSKTSRSLQAWWLLRVETIKPQCITQIGCFFIHKKSTENIEMCLSSLRNLVRRFSMTMFNRVQQLKTNDHVDTGWQKSELDKTWEIWVAADIKWNSFSILLWVHHLNWTSDTRSNMCHMCKHSVFISWWVWLCWCLVFVCVLDRLWVTKWPNNSLLNNTLYYTSLYQKKWLEN